jgi:adenylate cyclase
MQQLTLFSNSVLRGLRTRTNKQPRKSSRRTLGSAHWDLWTQQPEASAEKEMALFFLDIRNFTPLVERRQALDVIHIVKKLFSTFQNIIRHHHGRIIETAGDGFYAAFGFNGNIADGVNAAVQAGMAILKTLENMNSKSFEKNLQQRIDVGIGVHAGKVATGNLHIGSTDHFVVMGYPVNVASRIQTATRELNNSFIVSANAFDMLENPPLKNTWRSLNLKGVTEPVSLYLIGEPYIA